MSPDRKYGETWVYESIVGAIPGVSFSRAEAVAIQFLVFELLAIVVAGLYGRWTALFVGTVAIAVAALGSAVMLLLGQRIRQLDTPESYRQLLFGSKIEIVLGLLAYVAVIVYLFVYDPRTGGSTLLTELLGTRPPLPAVYLLLVVLWDVCYRIGVGWWASVVGLWLAVRRRDALSRATGCGFVRLAVVTIGYAFAQLALVPFIDGHPVLVLAVVGHVLAVTLVSGASAALITWTHRSRRAFDR